MRKMLLVLAWSSIAHADSGWRSLVTPSPLEADAAKLCAPLEQPPTAEVRRERERRMNVCYQAIAEQLRWRSNQATHRTGQEIGATRAAAADRCLVAMAKQPHPFASFSAERACGALDIEIESYEIVIRDGTPAQAAMSRPHLTAARRHKQDCLQAVQAALAEGSRVRDAVAGAVDIATLLGIEPSARAASERVRIAVELDDCRAEANSRRSARAATIATRSLDELLSIDPEFRTPEEHQQIAAAAEARYQRIQTRRADRRWMGPALSAAVCSAGAAKNEIAKEIRLEQAYAKQYGGIVDRAKLYDLQQQIRAVDDEIAMFRTKARRMRAGLQGCHARLVRQVAACLPREGWPVDTPDCRDARIAEHVELLTAPEFVDAGP